MHQAAKLAAMLAKLHTVSLLGIDALPVEVEVDVSPGVLPKTVLVGLPEQTVAGELEIEASTTYHVLYADLSVKEVPAEEVPKVPQHDDSSRP